MVRLFRMGSIMNRTLWKLLTAVLVCASGVALYRPDGARAAVVLTNLNALGTMSAAYGVNSSGAVAGDYVDPNSATRASLKPASGSPTDIHPASPGLTHSAATAINASGQVVGWTASSPNTPDAS